MGVRRLEVNVEELVLDGFPRADRFRIANAIKTELARLMSEGRQGSPVSTRQVDGGRFLVGANPTAEAIGKQVARAVHGGLSGKAGGQ
jgi:hypothetical protein